MIGSHITVPDGGAMTASPASSPASRSRGSSARRGPPPFALEVVDFLARASQFGLSCIGSPAIRRRSRPDLAHRWPARISLADAVRAVGVRPEALAAPLRERGRSCLPRAAHRAGTGPRTRWRAGRDRHRDTGHPPLRGPARRRSVGSGTTPMDTRRDALTGAAELVLAVRAPRSGRAGQEHFVGPIGSRSYAERRRHDPGDSDSDHGDRASDDAVLDVG